MSRIITLVLTTWVVTLSPVTAEEETNQAELELIGTAKIKAALFFHICDIRLFADNETTADSVLETRPLSLEIEYARSISRKRLVEFGNKGLDAEHSPKTIDDFSTKTEILNKAYVDVLKGDVYRLDYSESGTLILSLNGNQIVSIDKEGFGKYYLSIWLGENEEAKKIKRKLFRDQ